MRWTPVFERVVNGPQSQYYSCYSYSCTSWAVFYRQDPAVLREKNQLSKQRIRCVFSSLLEHTNLSISRALKKVGLDAFNASKHASPGHGLYTTFRHTPRPDPTPSTSANPCTKLNIIHEYPHPTAIDPGLMESSPTRHQTVGRCDEPSAHSPDHSLSESGIPEAICVDNLANVTSMSARTVFNLAYIHDPSFVTVNALNGATFPAPGHDEAICRGMGGGVFELDGIFSVREKADLTDLMTDYAKFFDNPEVIQMKDSTRMCVPTLSRNGCNLVAKVSLWTSSRLISMLTVYWNRTPPLFVRYQVTRLSQSRPLV